MDIANLDSFRFCYMPYLVPIDPCQSSVNSWIANVFLYPTISMAHPKLFNFLNIMTYGVKYSKYLSSIFFLFATSPSQYHIIQEEVWHAMTILDPVQHLQYGSVASSRIRASANMKMCFVMMSLLTGNYPVTRSQGIISVP